MLIFVFWFKYHLFIADHYNSEKGMLCTNIIMILLLPLFLYLKKQVSKVI